jgi:hypothetical protein
MRKELIMPSSSELVQQVRDMPAMFIKELATTLRGNRDALAKWEAIVQAARIGTGNYDQDNAILTWYSAPYAVKKCFISGDKPLMRFCLRTRNDGHIPIAGLTIFEADGVYADIPWNRSIEALVEEGYDEITKVITSMPHVEFFNWLEAEFRHMVERYSDS